MNQPGQAGMGQRKMDRAVFMSMGLGAESGKGEGGGGRAIVLMFFFITVLTVSSKLCLP